MLDATLSATVPPGAPKMPAPDCQIRHLGRPSFGRPNWAATSEDELNVVHDDEQPLLPSQLAFIWASPSPLLTSSSS